MDLASSPATAAQNSTGYTDALVLRNVTKRFGDFTAVDDLSLNIPKGSIYGFLGPNGAGKTTTIRMVMSIFYPDEGDMEVLGHPRGEEVKDRLGYLPEEKGLYKKMKTAEILAYFGKPQGHGQLRGCQDQRARELLDAFRPRGLGRSRSARCSPRAWARRSRCSVP